MVRYFYLFKNFPQFVVINTVKDFSVVNKAEVDVFLEPPLLSPQSNERWQFKSLVPLSLQNPDCTSENSRFRCCWRLACRILSITLLALKWVQLCGSLNILWHCFFGTRMKTDPYQSCGHCYVFQICWHIVERAMATHSSTLAWKIPWTEEPSLQSMGSHRVGHDWSDLAAAADILSAVLKLYYPLGFLNTSAGIPSPPLALFVVMLSKAHLTLYYRLSPIGNCSFNVYRASVGDDDKVLEVDW